jgi:predicted DNA-binding protein
MIEVVSVSVESQEFERLKRLAKKDGLSTSYLVRKAIKEYLERHEEEGKKK